MLLSVFSRDAAIIWRMKIFKMSVSMHWNGFREGDGVSRRSSMRGTSSCDPKPAWVKPGLRPMA